ncbi:hypothetical protein BDP81DRAFT_139433 [Colletotrichum phormii]|uniref:Secreted protein n=1 Tax=Colletotrichum phormii TaxID=359342 RepID=A0AAI9ZEL6_9PEZI|nr:uncharacterized protein BDP81DRAFT_139433 [Colletotrichum phormii]KAK1623120.1 hypothetical protein BDP81DRAFT_139433 [Colletotrichum phormii]
MLAYCIVILCLAIVAIVPGFLFRSCVEPVCGPFACSRTVTAADVLFAAFFPCHYVLDSWLNYSMWFIGDEWKDSSSAEALAPKPQDSEKAVEHRSGKPNLK